MLVTGKETMQEMNELLPTPLPGRKEVNRVVRHPGAANKKDHNKSHEARNEFDKTKKRQTKEKLTKFINLFKAGYECRSRNESRGYELEKDEETGGITKTRHSHGRGAKVTVKCHDLELRCTCGVSWLFCTTCKKELNPATPADVGVHVLGKMHCKNKEDLKKTSQQIKEIREVAVGAAA